MIRTRILLAVFILIALIACIIVYSADEAEGQPACKADTVVAIGGFNDPNSAVFNGKADVVVKHSGAFGDINGGIAAFDAAVKAARTACPDTKIVAAGFSQGAAVVHTWLQRNAAVPNKVAVLFADPKMVNSASAFWMRDANFGGTTTVSICRRVDVVCNLYSWNFGGYPAEHLRYDFDARKYAGKTGVIWQ